MSLVKGLGATVLVAGAALTAFALQASASDMKELVKSPQNFLGQQVEIKAKCIKGGRSGDVLGYECTTSDGVYINTDDITPDAAKEKLSNDCAGGACEASVTFEPHSYSTSAAIEPGKTVVIFNSKTAEVSF